MQKVQLKRPTNQEAEAVMAAVSAVECCEQEYGTGIPVAKVREHNRVVGMVHDGVIAALSELGFGFIAAEESVTVALPGFDDSADEGDF